MKRASTVAALLGALVLGAPTSHALAHRQHLRPAVLFVHGGGWARHTVLPQEKSVARTIHRDTGWIVRVSRYPTPKPGYVVEPMSVLADLKALRATAGVDRRRVFVWGESAGANLALLTAYEHPSLVAAAVGISTPTDLVTGDATLGYLTTPYEGESLAGSEAAGHTRYFTSSPVYEASADSPPTFLASSALDPAIPPSQATELDAALDRYHVKDQVELVPGIDAHAYDLEPYVMADAIAFLRRSVK